MYDVITKLLDNALYIGITEEQFWDMSMDEVQRAIQAYNKRKLDNLKEKASQDYQLANLIGISVSRIYSKSAKYPRIEEVYPKLFVEESEQYEQQKLALSVERFKAFAIQNNNKYSDRKEEKQ